MWQLTRDMVWEVNIISKCQFPSSYGFGMKAFDDFKEKDHRLNEWIYDRVTKVFVEQPRQRSVNNIEEEHHLLKTWFNKYLPLTLNIGKIDST